MLLTTNRVLRKTPLVIVALACWAFAIANLSLAQEEQSNDSEADANLPAVSVSNVVEDESISERLEGIFESAEWFKSLDVKSREGVVTLEGVADTEEHREWAESLARRTQDVVAVINKLEVENPVSIAGSQRVIETSLDRLWTDFLVQSPLILAALVVVVLTHLLSKCVVWFEQKFLEERSLRYSLKDLIYQLSSIGIWIVGFFTALIIAFPGMTPAKAFTTLGLGTLAVGFAFKDIFENFFAGILILWRYPVDRGDFIESGGITGQIEQITIRNTMLRKLDGELCVIPNAQLFKNDVDVLTNKPQRRVRIICGVAYGEDIDEAREVIRNAVSECETIQGARTVEVFAKEFNSSSVDFEVAWWTGSKPIDIRISRDEVVAAIKRALDNAGIEIPFPYRTLTFKSSEDADSLFAAASSEHSG